MSLIRLQNVSKRFEERVILRDVYFRLMAGERVGFVGRNGAGKTTVLKMILGQSEPTDGTVEITPGTRIGYFSQFSELDDDTSIQSILEGLFADVRTVETELDTIGQELETVTDDDKMASLLERQATLFEEMERREGWEYARHIDTVLTKLGFHADHRMRPIRQLSGGWRNRAALAKLLLEQPDVLLLDEPTNYLDVQGLAWLEGWLRQFRGAVLLVSHDRQFLDAVVSKIVEVENYHLHEYEGSFTDYVRQRQFRLKTLERQFEHEEELLIFEGEAIADRKELARDNSPSVQRKLADIRKRQTPRPTDLIITDIYNALSVPDQLCSAEHLTKAYGDQTLFQDVSFDLHKEERLAIVGSNGSGKSTLLRVLAGEEKPDAGSVFWPRGVSFADFNALQAGLDLTDTVGHAVNVTGLALHAQRKQVNRFLGLLQFSEMDQTQKIGTLSGGQKARVALTKCLLSGAQVLLLDEPTNHLDLPSAQVMERALVHFPGAVIVVSHDRFFLDKVATRLLVFETGGPLREVQGNWTSWQGAQSN
jgi:ATP-binding cassette subfamily F protein 3